METGLSKQEESWCEAACAMVKWFEEPWYQEHKAAIRRACSARDGLMVAAGLGKAEAEELIRAAAGETKYPSWTSKVQRTMAGDALVQLRSK